MQKKALPSFSGFRDSEDQSLGAVRHVSPRPAAFWDTMCQLRSRARWDYKECPRAAWEARHMPAIHDMNHQIDISSDPTSNTYKRSNQKSLNVWSPFSGRTPVHVSLNEGTILSLVALQMVE